MNRNYTNHEISLAAHQADLKRYNLGYQARRHLLAPQADGQTVTLFRIDSHEMRASGLQYGQQVFIKKRRPQKGDVILLTYNGGHKIIRRLLKENNRWVLKVDHWKEEVLIIHPTTIIEYFGVVIFD